MAEPDAGARVVDIDAERERVLDDARAQRLSPITARDSLAALPAARFASVLFAEPRRRPLIQPRGGFGSLEAQRALTNALDDAGADFIPLTIDSHTRHNDYERAAAVAALADEQRTELLNGYPLVCHGYELTRELFASIDRPVSLRHGTPDARLLVEVALASGLTDIEGGALSYTLPYSKAFPIDRALLYWQYVDRVCAVLGRDDAPIQRESFGPLTATLVPPVITVVVQLCELLLAAEQGVRSFSVSFGQTGSIEQDLAIARVLRELSAELLARFSFDVDVHLVYHQWMGAFPHDRVRALELIIASAVIAQLVAADKVVVKTTDEAFGVPTIERNVDAVRTVRNVFTLLATPSPLTSAAVDREVALIRSEVKGVLERIFTSPAPTFWQSVYSAVIDGVIDVPFSPHEQNASALMTVRDARGALRVIDPGRVPLSRGDLSSEAAALSDCPVDDGQIWERVVSGITMWT